MSDVDNLAREDAMRAQARASEEADDRRQTELLTANRAAARAEFNDSDQGRNSAQIREAERLMRLPTHQTLKETGAVIGDALKGPSS